MNSVMTTKMANMEMAVQLVACLVVLPRSAPAAKAPPKTARAPRPARMCLNFILLLRLPDDGFVGLVEFAVGATHVDPGDDDGEDDDADADGDADAGGHAGAHLG